MVKTDTQQTDQMEKGARVDSANRMPDPGTRAITPLLASLQFQPPGDVPGQIPNPNLPSPPPFDNVYSFSVFLHSQLPSPTNPGGPANHMGNTVVVVAPTMQAAYQAVVAQYGADLATLRGPCPSFVGASHSLSQAAGASAPVGASASSKGSKPAESDTTSSHHSRLR